MSLADLQLIFLPLPLSAAPLTGLCGEAAGGTQGFVPVQLGLYGVTASGFEFHNCS